MFNDFFFHFFFFDVSWLGAVKTDIYNENNEKGEKICIKKIKKYIYVFIKKYIFAKKILLILM